jgi:putative zinc finger/helix-turn-helix YgiT family protein
MKTAREDHRYVESGLRNVVLRGMEVSRCAGCGQSEVAIPAVEELHKAIARTIILKRARLVPEEVRFLRKHLGLRGVDLARRMGVSPETVSRWETGKLVMGVPEERLLRFLVSRHGPVERYEGELEGVAVEKPKAARMSLRREGGGWKPIRAA